MATSKRAPDKPSETPAPADPKPGVYGSARARDIPAYTDPHKGKSNYDLFNEIMADPPPHPTPSKEEPPDAAK